MRDARDPPSQITPSHPSLDDLTPFPVDVWTATSLLQKAIRRTEIATALRAAQTLHRWRGSATWRRLMVIAVEDVGIASTDAVVRTMWTATDMPLRKKVGDLPLLLDTVALLAAAPKDRSTDLLASAVQHHPDLEDRRKAIGSLPVAERIELATDLSADFKTRAVATWMACAQERGHDHRLRTADLKALLMAFSGTGVPDPVLGATWTAARATREPLTVLLPLLSQELTDAETIVHHLPAPRTVGDVPLFAFDKFTRLGLAAISAFVRESPEIRKVLAATVPKPKWRPAVGMGLYYADSALLARRVRWPLGDEIERLGIEADFFKLGVPIEAVAPLCAAVAANLDHFDDIRERLLIDQLGGAA